LLGVLRHLAATAAGVGAVRTGRIGTAFHRALLGEALGALEEELRTFTPALPAAGTCITHCLDPPALRRPAAVMRNRRHVLDGLDREAGGGERLDGRLTPGARALNLHVHATHAGRHGLARALLGGDGGRERRGLLGTL